MNASELNVSFHLPVFSISLQSAINLLVVYSRCSALYHPNHSIHYIRTAIRSRCPLLHHGFRKRWVPLQFPTVFFVFFYSSSVLDRNLLRWAIRIAQNTNDATDNGCDSDGNSLFHSSSSVVFSIFMVDVHLMLELEISANIIFNCDRAGVLFKKKKRLMLCWAEQSSNQCRSIRLVAWNLQASFDNIPRAALWYGIVRKIEKRFLEVNCILPFVCHSSCYNRTMESTNTFREFRMKTHPLCRFNFSGTLRNQEIGHVTVSNFISVTSSFRLSSTSSDESNKLSKS